jgi:nucleotide-binding universal stress UspA family protein
VRRLRMSIFPTKIILATDGSKDADLALSTAVDIANSTSSELHVITVAPGTPDPAYGSHELGFHWESYQEALEAVRKDAQEIIDEQVRKAEGASGTVAGAHLRTGERRDQAIVQLADELGAGLIVMGSRGLGGIRRALMGSVSDSVVRHAHCPVMVVRG